ncbi:MAG: glucokinase [Desulfovibrio sp.]|nr:glucokinase [Desulfovibrio sp.]
MVNESDRIQRLWVADIGGTNCRLALFSFEHSSLSLEKNIWVKTSDVCNAATLSSSLYDCFHDTGSPDGLAIAVAGPVSCGMASLTNASLHLTVDALRASLALPTLPLLLLNDFVAQAYATATCVGENAQSIRKGNRKASGIRAVLGAGTGLGCALLKKGGCLEGIASEGGHMPFPFLTDWEWRYAKWLQEELGRDMIEAEDVLSGRGLERLHMFLLGKKRDAQAIGSLFLQSESELLSHFARFYARFAHMWMLATCCTEGLWICGGIAQRNPLLLTCAAFHQELTQRQKNTWLSAIPIFLFTDKNAGLWGAAKALLAGRDRFLLIPHKGRSFFS